ncbi:MAG: hypothetical protein Q8P67_04290 [archaeon]|nr:hypothetical protein [archaeon]
MTVGLFMLLGIFTLVVLNGRGGAGAEDGEAEGDGEIYGLQDNRKSYSVGSRAYKVAVIADMDKGSLVEGHKGGLWQSQLREGVLTRGEDGSYRVEWEPLPTTFSSNLNEGGRSMELSALAWFSGRLLSFDDRTGVVFELDLEEGLAIPQSILMDGGGRSGKGFKSEWATVKGKRLYVGSTGKEWTNAKGEVENLHPLWVKQLSPSGSVAHLNWTPVYDQLRAMLRAEWPGYVLHEAVVWNNLERRWYFFPRRVSREMYDEVTDELRGANAVVSCDELFRDFRLSSLGPHHPTHGFSAAQFVPWREDEVVVLKTEEHNGKTGTYIAVYRLDGTVLMPESFIEGVKYEGLEFLPQSRV